MAYDMRRGEVMTTMTATEARKNLYALVDEVSVSHEPVQIAGKRNSAVLISEDDWRAIQETLYLTGVPGMRESIVVGLKTPVDECEPEPGW
jgi:prevent-host-death family protein